MLATKTVYSLYFQETRRIVDALWSERPHWLYEKNYEKRQDALHGPLLALWRRWLHDAGVELADELRHEYPTAGASEAIHALLARIATAGAQARVHVFAGEYEGYAHTARALGLEVMVHPRRIEDLLERARAGDWLFVSQPSAIDGCEWPELNALIRSAAERLPELSLCVDLTYVGSVPRRLAVDLRAPNVAVVLASLSKPFGVYYHRIGMLASRFELPSLYANLWFKNVFSIALGQRLLESHPAVDLPTRHQPAQRAALARLIAAGLAPDTTRVSDVVLLAHARLDPNAELSPAVAEFTRVHDQRQRVLRYCLTPAMDGARPE